MVLVSIYKDRVFEELAKQHGTDGHVTNYNRRNGQQNQWHCDHPRRLVRTMVVVAVIIMVIIVSVVCIWILVIALFAMEYLEVDAE